MPKVNKEFDKINYDKQYQAEHYERMNVVLHKGKKAIYKEQAAKEGKSLNKWICDLLDEACK